MIEFSNYPFSDDIFIVIAYKPLVLPTIIKSIYKNGADVTQTLINMPAIPGAFNYETDQIFKDLYLYFR